MAPGKQSLARIVCLWLFIAGSWQNAFGEISKLRCSDCNVVLISLDTCRADHLSVYGYHRDTTKFLEKFAETGVLFKQAISTAAKTVESHMTMFTGLYPSAHGVMTPNSDGSYLYPLNKKIPSLAELVKKKGLTTIGFHGAGNVSERYGFDRGFDHYQYAKWMFATGFEPMADKIMEHINDQFFAFIHTYYPHDPYGALPPFDTYYNPSYKGDIIGRRGMLDYMLEDICKGQTPKECGRYKKKQELFWGKVDLKNKADIDHIVSLYDGSIKETDYRLISVKYLLETVWDKTMVIVLSDHGEEFLEHGGTKHLTLYQEILHVPFLIKFPGQTGPVVIEEQVSLVDLAPTILDFLKLPVPKHMQGRSLLPVIAGEEKPQSLRFAELPKDSLHGLIDGNYKFIVQGGVANPDYPNLKGLEAADIAKEPAMAEFANLEMYDLVKDPKEKNPLSPDHPDYVAMFKKLLWIKFESENLYHTLTGGFEAEKEEIPDDTLNELKALGYVE